MITSQDKVLHVRGASHVRAPTYKQISRKERTEWTQTKGNAVGKEKVEKKKTVLCSDLPSHPNSSDKVSSKIPLLFTGCLCLCLLLTWKLTCWEFFLHYGVSFVENWIMLRKILTSGRLQNRSFGSDLVCAAELIDKGLCDSVVPAAGGRFWIVQPDWRSGRAFLCCLSVGRNALGPGKPFHWEHWRCGEHSQEWQRQGFLHPFRVELGVDILLHGVA